MKLGVESIGMENAPQVAELGRAAIAGGDAHVDLSGVARCDSSAIAVLLEWQRAAAAQGLALTVQGVPAALRSLATVYGVTEVLPALDAH